MRKLIFLLLLLPSIALAGFLVDRVTDPATVDGVSEPASVDGVTSDYAEQDLPSTKDNTSSITLGGDNPGNEMIAGRFTASSAYTCTKIGFYVHAVIGSPDQTLTGYIYSKTSDNSWEDEPNVLLETSSATVSASTAVADTYIDLLFTGEALTNGEDYWAVIMTSAADASNYIDLRRDTTDSQRVVKSDDDPVSWVNAGISTQLYLKLYSGGS